jgi:hypothetical protein
VRPYPSLDPTHSDPGEPNAAQRQSDATPDVNLSAGVEETSTGNTANGIAPFDEADGVRRRKLYASGATLVSRLD